MIVLGLTGSIGMGKSTVAEMMKKQGIPVHDSDAAVHELIRPGGKAYAAITAAFPYFEYPALYQGKEKTLCRETLGKIVFGDEERRARLELIVHPFVQESQQDFLKKQRSLGAEMAVLDIPLLFETGAEARVDYTINCSAPVCVQKARVMARPGMTTEKFYAINAAQMPDEEKCARADFVLKTGLNRAQTIKELKKILQQLRSLKESPHA